MKSFLTNLSILALAAAFCLTASAQSPSPEAGDKVSGGEFETLMKKVDEQSVKIDALSQQILKLEQQISSIRPGVMIGENAPLPSVPPTAAAPSTVPTSGNAHVVTKGETLTSIAKANKVGVSELQKFNHIENDRALQIGQTIMIPPGPVSPPASSPSSSPNE